ncbi:unnamed protein product [Clonostachys rosea f. rosea IK726]|uniref:N-acetyltransferase domain-containing protein n=2 Tax=Bionectria ochroleuca TaxID=29856 RepID=A0A0B7KBU9_BIOOC|nr:unnamed protein product [Clonostachys rosea f. rosea IK726]
MTSNVEYKVTKLTRDDYDEWAVLFRAYIDFYRSSIDDEQYKKTFDRIIVEKDGLQALVVRQVGDGTEKMVGIAHFFPELTPWSEKKIMMLNDLFVDPAIRGQGLGRKLIEAVADVARDTGCLRLQWLTKHDNVTARALYDKLADTQFVQYRMAL